MDEEKIESKSQEKPTKLSPEDTQLAQGLVQNYKTKIITMLANTQQNIANSLDELINDRVVLGAQVRQLKEEIESLKLIIKNLKNEVVTPDPPE